MLSVTWDPRSPCITCFIVILNLVSAQVNRNLPGSFDLYYEQEGLQQVVAYTNGALISLTVIGRLVIDLKSLHFVNNVTSTGDGSSTVRVQSEYYDGSLKHQGECGVLMGEVFEAIFECYCLARILRMVGNFTLELLYISGYNTYYENLVGCYMINGEPNSLSELPFLGSCLKLCMARERALSAVSQNGENRCLCLNSLSATRFVDLNMCSEKCSQHPMQSCGGETYYSVYSRDPQYSKKQANDSWDCFMFGRNCPECAPGRAGYNCDSIDCSHNNGNCGESRCLDWVATYERSNCFCEDGLQLTSDMKCVDMDECKLGNACNKTTSTCINAPTSYACQCKPGFRETFKNVCSDVNECLVADDMCRQGLCINTHGSYLCECPSDFERIHMDDTVECREVTTENSGKMERSYLFPFILMLYLLLACSVVLCILQKRRDLIEMPAISQMWK